MLTLLLVACQSVEPSWDLFTPVAAECGPEGEVVAEEAVVVDPMFEEMRRRAACADDPLNCDSDDAEPEPEPEVAEVEPEPEVEPSESEPEPESEPAIAEVEDEGAPAALPDPIGMATQPNWGVRLLKTLPTAQPPRAALGLSDGTELVVSPGSMIPEAGLVIVSVGDGIAQVATVEAAGDHAQIGTLTLHAQY